MNQNIKNAKYFVKWLQQEEIDYTEYALSAHLQLKYQALMTGAFPRFIALLTQNDEKIVYNKNKYQPKTTDILFSGLDSNCQTTNWLFS